MTHYKTDMIPFNALVHHLWRHIQAYEWVITSLIFTRQTPITES